MPAYAISEVEAKDAAAFEAYRTIAAGTVAQYGGRYLVRGGAAELTEGGPPAENDCCRRISVDGTLARMVRFA
jgi:uncharacterized protein (DUF1330 family)